MNDVARPAFYALAPGGWRDYVTLLQPPYTAWHLSYVVLGAALAPQWRPGILGLALLAFFLGTDDFRRDYEAMTAAGVKFVREPSVESYGTVAVFEDLYGNLWDFVEPRP